MRKFILTLTLGLCLLISGFFPRPLWAGSGTMISVAGALGSLVAYAAMEGSTGLCYSGYLNMGNGALALIMELASKDEAQSSAESLKAQQAQACAKPDGAECQQVSCQVQVASLRDNEANARKRASGFNQNMIMFTLAIAVGALEALDVINTAHQICGMINGGLAVLGLGTSIFLKSTATKDADDAKRQADELEKNCGRFATLANTGNIARDGAKAVAIDKNIDLRDLGGNQLNLTADNENIEPPETKASLCISGSSGQNKLDKNCECRETKTCTQFNVGKIDKLIADTKLSDALGVKGTLADANKMLRGEYKIGNLDSNAMAKRAQKARDLAPGLIKKLNANANAATGGKHKDFKLDDKALAKHIARSMRTKNFRDAQNLLGMSKEDVMRRMPYDSNQLLADDDDDEDDFARDPKNIASVAQSSPPPTNRRDVRDDDSYNDDYDNDLKVANITHDGDEDQLGIHQSDALNDTTTIFDIISTRYLALRSMGRFKRSGPE